MSLAKYLHPASGEPPHPILRKWEFKRAQPGVEKLTVQFWRERDGLTFRPAELHVRFVDAAGRDQAEPDSQLWDRRLDAWLIRRGAKAEPEPNEAERFGYALQDRFSEAIEQVGDGYFNAVLAEFLRQDELGALPNVAEKLKDVRENNPYRSKSRDDCKAMIEAAIMSVGRDLTGPLAYDDKAATQVLGAALAYFLDERFGLTNQRMLGWLLRLVRGPDPTPPPRLSQPAHSAVAIALAWALWSRPVALPMGGDRTR
jgi:hypothetical protein